MKTILQFFNDNHWWAVAAVCICFVLVWTYGCESEVASLIKPAEKVNRAGLKAEVDYLLAQAANKAESLDQQDLIKQQLLDSMSLIGSTNQINPSGLISILASIGAISFGLNRNQVAKKYQKKIVEGSSDAVS